MTERQKNEREKYKNPNHRKAERQRVRKTVKQKEGKSQK